MSKSPELIAMVRSVSPTIGACELTYLPRQEIDVSRALLQHETYKKCLANLGVRVVSLPAEPEMPDAVFVEDPVVVVDEVAILARTGVESRRKEADSLAQALAPYRSLRNICAPATLEGGDVLRAGRDIFVGLSPRTNEAGVAQLAAGLAPFGYLVRPVAVRGALHFKTACSDLGERTLLVNRSWLDAAALDGYNLIDVAESEPWAANALRIGETVLMPAGFPRTEEIVRRAGFRVHALDVSELQKAEGSVTCLSVVFKAEAQR
jgi:dimethylargininase